jgi:hypothetical protein
LSFHAPPAAADGFPLAAASPAEALDSFIFAPDPHTADQAFVICCA